MRMMRFSSQSNVPEKDLVTPDAFSRAPVRVNYEDHLLYDKARHIYISSTTYEISQQHSEKRFEDIRFDQLEKEK